MERCYSAFNDDFNSPIVISHLFDAVKNINLALSGNGSLTSEDISELKRDGAFCFDLLGLSAGDQSSSKR